MQSGAATGGQIVFEHCQAKVTHPAKTEVLGNVIYSLTRDRIGHSVV